MKTKQFHWNLQTPHFTSYHEFFGKLYNDLDESIDDTAERIRALGVLSPGTYATFLNEATIEEHNDLTTNAIIMLKALLADHEEITRGLRDAIAQCAEIGDAGNEDYLISLMQYHEKTAWMLRSTLD